MLCCDPGPFSSRVIRLLFGQGEDRRGDRAGGWVHIRAGLVTHADLQALHDESRLAVFLGVRAGDHLIYIAEAGSDDIAGFEARSNIHRTLLSTAGGKALLASTPAVQRESYLRRHSRGEAELVDRFLSEFEQIQKSHVATNWNATGTRLGIAATVYNRHQEAVASITIVGPAADVKPRLARLSKLLLKHVDGWTQRSVTPREAI